MKTILEALEDRSIESISASSEFRVYLEKWFPDWKGGAVFCEAIPKYHSPLRVNGLEVAFLWSEQTIVKNHARSNSPHFLGVGSLQDASILALDTRRSKRLQIGAFSKDLCGASNWSDLKPAYFRQFPFSYAEYLTDIVESLDIRYLVG